ncbi:hypothetical protein C8F04DRAFT_1394251 [Mycena alexandri]|uniref:F-box domain-containing protein n=1 Tax=Mycena alexandri TaxID=1745969 RepID=A0AAD6T0T7_9AGAR|nr:hypothetical protein C8F04DRAFT_1394251 [Mycena alexandri]
MDSGFLSLPPDLVLEVSMHLSLADAIDLLSTCKTLRQCCTEKSFWLHALVRVHQDQKHPIAVPLLQDLSALTLAELTEAGKRTNRLMKNWRSEIPKPESVREIYVDLMSDILVIPGANLIITHGTGFVACWDILRQCSVGRLVESGILVESSNFGEYGKVMLGATKQNSYCFEVLVICVDYRNRAAVSISLLLQHTFAYPRRHFYQASPVTVDANRVRVVVTTFDPWEYTLLSVSLAGNEETMYDFMPPVPRGVPVYGPPKVSIISSPNGPYFLRHMQNSGDITHLSGSPVTPSTTTTTTVPLGTPNKSLQIKHFTPADPAADIVCVTSGQFMVEFWQARRDADAQLVFDNVSPYAADRVVNSVVAGASGTYALVALHPGSPNEAPLRLLHCFPGGALDHREIRVPDKTLYVKEGQIALDDHLGLILSVRGDGRLRIASYA